jgi:hypothetical protein
MFRVFICYSKSDEMASKNVCTLVNEIDGVEAFYDTVFGGDSIPDTLREIVSDCDICVFIQTQNSRASPWCAAELGAFWGAGKAIIPYKPLDEPPTANDSRNLLPTLSLIKEIDTQSELVLAIKKKEGEKGL